MGLGGPSPSKGIVTHQLHLLAHTAHLVDEQQLRWGNAGAPPSVVERERQDDVGFTVHTATHVAHTRYYIFYSISFGI